MREQLSDLLGRKMVIFYLSFIGIFILVLMGKLGDDTFMFIFGWLITNVIGGNIAEWKYKTASLTGLTQTPDKEKINFLKD